MPAHIDVPRHQLAEFCRRHQIQLLSLFGSVLREDFRPDSDIDVLVEFEHGHAPGILSIARMERELSEILSGRKADLRTPEDLSLYFRQEALAQAGVQYAQGR